MIMPMPAQQMQIMTQSHFTSQNSFAPQGQGNVSFVPAQQVATQKTSYHQTAFSHSTHQVSLCLWSFKQKKKLIFPKCLSGKNVFAFKFLCEFVFCF